MTDESNPSPPQGGQFLVYRTEDGKLKIDVRFEGETVWLTQQHMAALFQTTKQNVGLHIQNVFSEGELREDSVVKESLTTAPAQTMNGAETRAERSDPAPKAAGWGIVEGSKITVAAANIPRRTSHEA